MTSRGLEIRVGAVVLLAAIILVVGTMWFQRFQIAEKRYDFFVRFTEVGGLIQGDPVFVNGVERGRVENVDLLGRQVVVEMAVRQNVEIPVDSRVSLQAVGIMGERQVTIRLGVSDQAVAPGDTLDGALLMGLGEVMGKAGDIIDEVEGALANLRDVTAALSEDNKLRDGINDFAATGKNLRQMTDSNKDRFDTSMENFEKATTRLDKLMSDHYAELDSSFAALGRAGVHVEASVEHLSAISEDLKHISANLRAGKGSAGRLLTDDTLVHRMEAASASLDSLLKDMRENPGRYVKFSLF
jgi:phospholipid/cholesterol/gamma-HCH transport system substrate-binding protein